MSKRELILIVPGILFISQIYGLLKLTLSSSDGNADFDFAPPRHLRPNLLSKSVRKSHSTVDIRRLETNDNNSDNKWWLGQLPERPHPYMGARHPNGSNYMKVDPSPFRLESVDITKHPNGAVNDLVCPLNGIGFEGREIYNILKKVRGGVQRQLSLKNATRRSRILCMVYTVDLPKSTANLRSIAQTWGQKCDGFFAASNVTSHSIGAVDLPHVGEEAYSNMWQKVRSMWGYVIQAYKEDYDWFFIGGDDTYVAVDNLRAYIDGPDVMRLEDGYLDEFSSHKNFLRAKSWKDVRPRPLLLGAMNYRHDDKSQSFHLSPNGGSGYVLNRAAVELLSKPTGLNTFEAEKIEWREDLMMGALFSLFGVYVSNHIDQHHAARFIGNREFDVSGQPGTLDSEHPSNPSKLREVYGVYRKGSIRGVSEEAVSFHLKYVNHVKRMKESKKTVADMMKRYHAVFYDLCEENSLPPSITGADEIQGWIPGEINDHQKIIYQSSLTSGNGNEENLCVLVRTYLGHGLALPRQIIGWAMMAQGLGPDVPIQRISVYVTNTHHHQDRADDEHIVQLMRQTTGFFRDGLPLDLHFIPMPDGFVPNKAFYGYDATNYLLNFTLQPNNTNCNRYIITNGDNSYHSDLLLAVNNEIRKSDSDLIGFDFTTHHFRKGIPNTKTNAKFRRTWIDLGAVVVRKRAITELCPQSPLLFSYEDKFGAYTADWNWFHKAIECNATTTVIKQVLLHHH